MPAQYYNKVLYPLQNEVFPVFEGSPFYLTDQLVNDPFLGIVDSKENILANKLTAIVDRTLPKDIVDVYFLLKDGLSLRQSLLDAKSKAAGISPLLIAKILAEFDYTIIDSEIKWVSAVSSETIKHYLKSISLSIIKGNI